MSNDALKINKNVEASTDTVGTGGPLNTGLYKMGITAAYVTVAASNAVALCLELESVDGAGSRYHSEKLWMVSGDKKGNKNFYTDKNGKDHLLPGMEMANNIAMITTGKAIAELSAEQAVVGIYNYDSKKKEPVEVPVYKDLVGKAILIGLVQKRVNKQIKGSNGQWEDSNEPRTFTELEKVFSPAGLTATEMEAGVKDPTFVNEWKSKRPSTFVRDTFKGTEATSASGATGAVVPAVSDELFN